MLWPILMKIIYLGTLIFISTLGQSLAMTPVCAPAISLTDFKNTVDETRMEYFPEFESDSLTVTTFHSSAYFLQAQPSLSSLLHQRADRTYEVQLNLRLLDCPPERQALKAILVHELEHVRDYRSMSSAKIISLGMKVSLSFDFKVHYERATDQKVLNKGLFEGLALYREWVYQWLSPKELIKKRAIYMTPEEIRRLIKDQS